jgi:hypothetical protein
MLNVHGRAIVCVVPGCRQVFPSSFEYWQHRKYQHFKCETCTMDFPTELKREIHVKNRHLGFAVCNLCAAPFIRGIQVLAHVKIVHQRRANVCINCAEEFPNGRMLFFHLEHCK